MRTLARTSRCNRQRAATKGRVDVHQRIVFGCASATQERRRSLLQGRRDSLDVVLGVVADALNHRAMLEKVGQLQALRQLEQAFGEPERLRWLCRIGTRDS